MARTQALPVLACAFAVLQLVRQTGLLFSGAGTSRSLRQSSPRRSLTALRAEEGSAGSGSDRVQLKVLSPEGLGVTEAVSEVVLPSASGQLGVLANHAPMMTALDIGVLRYKQAGQWKPLVVMGGFASVDSNQLSILVNDFEKVEDIDLDAAKKDMDSATSALEKADSKKVKLDATQSVKRAAARVQAAMFGQKK
uniref:ATP synthase F1 complex delta/epsilon subunit N-terminal domain-containing protein n=1 Tax=Alexandrium monilatum TaxID=311494 RepID=A0A7S4RSU9_9DINO